MMPEKTGMTTGTSMDVSCYIAPELVDCTNGIYNHLSWILKTVKEKKGWKIMSEKRWRQLIIEAYWLGRNNEKPEQQSLMDLLPRVKNKGVLKWSKK